MNTTKIGNLFEEKVHTLIENAIKTEKLGLIESQCKVYAKKGYYSKDREGNIKFDLTIELWPPNSKNFSLLYIIECKNYNHKVPIDDLEEFYSKINQVTGANRKGIFITNNSFQKSAYNFAKNKGIMLIEVLSDDSLNFILHRTTRSNSITEKSNNKFEERLENLIINLFKNNDEEINENIIEGLEILSKKDIETIVKEILLKFDENIFKYGVQVNLKVFQRYLEIEFGLKFEFTSELEDEYLGVFDNKNKVILINDEISGTNKLQFTLAHEIGHFFLHSNLHLNQEIYNKFEDSQFNYFFDRYQLQNPKNWIEWQANYFAACLLMPKIVLIKLLIAYQRKENIRNEGQIYLDNQPDNYNLYRKTIDDLALRLNVSKSSLKYRMKELGILINDSKINV